MAQNPACSDFLNVNVDKLFEQHKIEEIQQILQKMRAEAEKKREDLRVTVGNRYRDLIEAADTICEMKNAAAGVVSNLEDMQRQMVMFKHRQIVGFRTEEQSHEMSRENSQTKREYLSLAAQIRLLMDLPEKVWNLLDENNFCRAAQVLQLAQHLHTALIFQTESEQNVASWFPIVSRQWAALSSFNDVISNLSLNVLRQPQLCVEDAANALGALLLLEGQSSTELLQRFLRTRSEALEILGGGFPQNGTKMQICGFVTCISRTISAVHSLFVEGFSDSELPQSGISDIVKSTSQPGAPRTVEFLNLPSGAILKYLPSLISEFRPNFRQAWETIPLSVLRQVFVEWFESVGKWARDKISELLSFAVSVKTLAGIREAVHDTLKNDAAVENWDELMTRLLGRSVSLWDDIVRPPVVSKIHTILRSQLESAFSAVTNFVTQKNQEIYNSESEAMQWLWTELAADLPQSVAAPRGSSGVYMKTRGYTPCVQQVCGLLDQKLRILWEDVQHYQEGKIQNPQETAVFDRFQDRVDVYAVLECATGQIVEKITRFLKEDSQGVANLWKMVFASRLAAALTHLAPHLKLCLTAGKGNESKTWLCTIDSLRSCTVDLLETWKNEIIGGFSQKLEKNLTFSSLPDALKATPAWEEIVIEEEGESGKAVQSHIRVPMNPSLPLQNCLFELCKEVNSIGCHTIPKRVQASLMEDTARSIVTCYGTYAESNGSRMTQPVALQLLFDVRFVSSLLLSRDSKDLCEKSKRVCESLEGRVDPFDLDVFSPHLQRNVKLAVQRLQFLYAPLLTSDRHAVLWAARSVTTATTAATTQPDNPILLALASTNPRFLLLPLTNQSALSSNAIGRKEEEAPNLNLKSNLQVKKNVKDNKRESSPMVGSAAAAFFGAVSSSWSSSIFGSGGGDN